MTKLFKIVVTGHTSGIGKSIFDKLQSGGHTVTGYSLDNGYDIGNNDVRNKIIDDNKDADIFINNAYHFTGQIILLKEFIRVWKNQNKLIVNIGSLVVENNPEVQDLKYIAAKKKLNDVAKSYNKNMPNITNIVLDWVKTPLSDRLSSAPMMSSDSIATFVNFIIDNKSNFWARDIVLCNSRKEKQI